MPKGLKDLKEGEVKHMYDNAGSKVKGLAYTITTLLMIVAVLAGMVAMIDSVFGGLLVMVIGCIAAWLSGLTMAAFGELVENTYYIRKMLAYKLNVSEKGEPLSVTPAYVGENMAPVNANTNVTSANGNGNVMPVYDSASVTPADIHAIMLRDGVPYGEAFVIAKREKKNAAAKTSEGFNCPNCGFPCMGGDAFCTFCGTEL